MIGEVFDADPKYVIPFQTTNAFIYALTSNVAPWQGPLDAVLQYPMYNALVEAFTIPGPLNMSALGSMVAQSQALFTVRPSHTS
jgi:hypothetical protein